MAGEQGRCWDDEAEQDEIHAAAAVSKSETDSIFVKMPAGLQRAEVAGKVYVDLGCGYGRTLLYAARDLQPSVALGLDISQVMLEKARTYAQEHGVDPVLARASIDELPLRSDSVDFVYSSAVLLHLPEQMVRRTLQEVVRVLRPGGVALFESCFIGWLNPDGAQTKLISSLARGRLRVAFVRTYRRKDVERLVSAVGRLSDVKIEPEGYRVLPKEVARVSMGRFKPAIARFNRRASERLRFKSFLVEGWSVQLVK